MSTLEFIASLVKSLAWPVALLVLALLFRSQLRQMLSRQVKRMKAGPIELEWDRTLSEAEVELDQPGGPRLEAGRAESGIAAELSGLAASSPATAVLEAHMRIENELRRITAAAEPDGAPEAGAAGLARHAGRLGLITPETVRAVEGITVLRNLAAHGRAGEVSAEQARDYLSLIDAVLYTLGNQPH